MNWVINSLGNCFSLAKMRLWVLGNSCGWLHVVVIFVDDDGDDGNCNDTGINGGEVLVIMSRNSLKVMRLWLKMMVRISWGLLRGYCTSYPKLTCFVLCFKIINTLKIIYAFHSKLFKELKKWHWNFSRQSLLKLWIKTVKMVFGSITQELLGLP